MINENGLIITQPWLIVSITFGLKEVQLKSNQPLLTTGITYTPVAVTSNREYFIGFMPALSVMDSIGVKDRFINNFPINGYAYMFI